MFYKELDPTDEKLNLLDGTVIHDEMIAQLNRNEAMIIWGRNAVSAFDIRFVEMIQFLVKYTYPTAEIKFWENVASDNIYVTAVKDDTLFYGLEIRKDPSWLRRYKGGGKLEGANPVEFMLKQCPCSSFFRFDEGKWILRSGMSNGTHIDYVETDKLTYANIKFSDGMVVTKNMMEKIGPHVKKGIHDTDVIFQSEEMHHTNEILSVTKIETHQQNFISINEDEIVSRHYSGGDSTTIRLILDDYGYPSVIMIDEDYIYSVVTEEIIEDLEVVGVEYFFLFEDEDQERCWSIMKKYY